MQAEIRAMSLECEKVGGINLAQGVCDMQVPDLVRRAAKAAIDGGTNIYTRFDGRSWRRHAVALRASARVDYTSVTESTGTPVTREGLSMLYTRYRAGAPFCKGKDVLEVACGSGQGLGYLGAEARRVVGGDYTEDLLRLAQAHYGKRIPLVRLDAHKLPFSDKSFDVVILYEAIYYLQNPKEFVLECRRVLRPDGHLLVSTVNKEWSGFIPSPFSVNYLTARELYELLTKCGFSVELYAAFPASMGSARDLAIFWMRKIVASLRLVPRTMRGKAVLKKLIFGRLAPVPPEVTEGMSDFSQLVPIDYNSSIPGFKVIYAFGQCT